MKLLAADIPLAPGGGYQGKGPLGLEGSGPEAATGIFNKFISSTVGVMTVIAFIWFIFLFVSGAISIMTSGGDKASLETARKRLFTGIVGIVVVIAAIFIIDLIGNLLGIPEILNPAKLIEDVSIK